MSKEGRSGGNLACDKCHKIGARMEVKAKGIERSVTLYEVFGVGKPYKPFLPDRVEALLPLTENIPIRYEIVEANHLGGESHQGVLTKLSPKGGEARLENPVPVLGNLKMHLISAEGQDLPGALYAKVVGAAPEGAFAIRFTSSSAEIEAYLRALLPLAA